MMNNRSSDPSSLLSDNDFAELQWENGQIVLHGHKNMNKLSSTSSSFPASPFASFTSSTTPQEKAGSSSNSHAVMLPKFGHFGRQLPPSIHDYFPAASQSAASPRTATAGLASKTTQDDDNSIPWTPYPTVDDALPPDYCWELLSDQLPADRASLTSLPAAAHNATVVVTDKTNPTTNFANMSPDPPSKQCQSSVQTKRSEPMDLDNIGGTVVMPQDPTMTPSTTQKQQKTCSQSLMNFSMFSRPVAIARANHHNADMLKCNERVTTTGASFNRLESTIIQSVSGRKSTTMVQGRAAPLPLKELGSRTDVPMETASLIRQPHSIHERAGTPENNITRNLSSSHIIPHSLRVPTSAPIQGNDGGKAPPEAGVATSSVCSGNGDGTATGDSKQRLKRKSQEECSTSPEEDLEDESRALKRRATRGSRRIRTAEVHNLSERRRRDRINEKMRALQELIPNCNKVDKASMLEEAIEYLKTLQLQVQMMSMGSGRCIPPMMMPTMQHLQIPPPMAYFSQMGMGMGYGMGMLDMSASPSGCPPMPFPALHAGHQFPCTAVPGAQSLYTYSGLNSLPMFTMPGHGIPSAAARVPPSASLAGFPVRANSVPQMSTTVAIPSAEQLQSFENHEQQNVNLGAAQRTELINSHNQDMPSPMTMVEKQLNEQPALRHTTSLNAEGSGANCIGKNGAEPAETTSDG